MTYLESPSFGLDAMTLKAFGSMLQRLPREVQNEVRRSNRRHAAELRDLIRAEAPRTSRTAGREGRRHDTRHGAIRNSIVSRAGAAHAYIRGGGPRAPHFISHEFGGSVFWTKGGGGRAKYGRVSAEKMAAMAGLQMSGRGAATAWTRVASSKGHAIPSGGKTVPYKPHIAVFTGIGSKHGAESYFFFSTAGQHIPRIQASARDAAVRIIHDMLGKGHSTMSLAA